MGFKDLTKEREKYIQDQENRVQELELKDLTLLLKWKHSRFVLETLSKKDMTKAQLTKLTSKLSLNIFLRHACGLGVIERYYDKNTKKYYLRLITREIRTFIA